VGTVTLGNNAVLKADAVSGGKAGNIDIEAKTLNITPGTLISAATREATIDGNSLIISASDHVSMSGASIFSRTTDSGDTGNISITAPALSMDSAASISVNTTARGTAGAITIGVDLLTMTNGGALSSTSGSLGGAAGSGGQILIQGRSGEGSYAQSVNLDNSTISTSANAGPGGAIEIKAGNIDLRNGTTVSATTQGINNAGNIMLTSDDNIVITNSTVSTSATQATGGNIILTAPNMVWLNGGALQSDITDANTAGTGGGIHIQANDVRVEAAATITASLSCTAGSSCAGKAGDISIMAGSLSINSGAALSANTRGQGNAGNISITASDLVTIYGSGSKLATETTAGGAAGAITMNVNQLTMTNGGEISSTSRSLGGSAGSGGQILIQGQGGKGTYSQSVSLDKSSIKTSANAGPGGTIEIRGSNIELRNGSNVKASTLGTNDAGGITLTSSDNIAITNSTVETSAIRGSGGNITLTAPDTIRVTNAQLTSSVGGSSESDAGNIRINTIHPQFVIVSNSEISANANEGKGGNIFIIPQYQVIQGNTRLLAKAGAGIGGKIDVIASRAVLIEPGSELNASAGPAGIDGQVNIQAPIQQLAGAIAPLPQAFAVATNLYGQRCAAEKGGQFSSFVQGARDGVPPQPGDLMMSPVLDFDETTTWLVPERGSSLSEVSSIAGNKATEALVNIRNVSPTHLQLWPEDRAGVFHVSDACQ
jgi:large exoprotein involved in heme utilization and adhesion